MKQFVYSENWEALLADEDIFRRGTRSMKEYPVLISRSISRQKIVEVAKNREDGRSRLQG